MTVFGTEKNEGFTIIELVVTILVIGVLAMVVVLTFNGVVAKEHNNTRVASIKLIQSHLETYYAENGFYPTLADLNNPAWVQKNLQGLDESDLRDPSAKLGKTVITGVPSKGAYSYQVTASNDASACDNKTVPCAEYTLTATLQDGGGTFSEQSLNQ